MRIFSILMGLVYTSTCIAQINTNALEEALNSSLLEVISYFVYVDSGEIQVDHDYTNLETGRLKFQLNTKTIPLKSNTNQSNEAESIAISANMTTDLQSMKENKKLFSATAGVELKANTISVLKSIAYVYGECSSEQNQRPDTQALNANKEILCILMDSFRASKKITDLTSGLKKAIEVAKKAYGKDEQAEDIISQIFSSLKIETNNDSIVLNFTLKGTPLPSLSLNDINAEVSLIIKEDGLNLSANSNVLLEAEQVEVFLEQVKMVATKLADRNSDLHINYYEENLYLVFGVIEAFLVVEENEEDDDDGTFGDDSAF